MKSTPEKMGFALSVISGPVVTRSPWGESPSPLVVAFRCIITKGGTEMWRGPFYLGAGHVKGSPKNATIDQLESAARSEGLRPSLESVLSCLISDGAAFFDNLSFEEWAADYGYSSDSIKAKETWQTCEEIGREFSNYLTPEELSGLREWAANY